MDNPAVTVSVKVVKNQRKTRNGCLELVLYGISSPEGSEEKDEEVLTVEREARHQAVHGLHLVRLVLHLDDLEDGSLVVGSEDTAGDLPEELLHDAGDGVEGVVLDVDQSALQRQGCHYSTTVLFY